MSWLLDTATTDTYQELLCPGTKRVTVQTSNASIYIGFGHALGQARKGVAIYDQDEVLLPSLAGLDRDCDAIRVKNYKPGVSANVKVTASPDG